MFSLSIQPRTWLHAVPAGLKLTVLAIATVSILPIGNPAVLAAVLAAVLGLYLSLGRSAIASLRMLRPILLVLGMLAGFHWIVGTIEAGAVVILRILTLVAMANLVTITTRLSDMRAIFERLLTPLRYIGVAPKGPGLAMALTIRFIPHLTMIWSGLAEAWRSRSARRPGWRLLGPMCIAALDAADRTGEALAARGGARSLAIKRKD